MGTTTVRDYSHLLVVALSPAEVQEVLSSVPEEALHLAVEVVAVLSLTLLEHSALQHSVGGNSLSALSTVTGEDLTGMRP